MENISAGDIVLMVLAAVGTVLLLCSAILRVKGILRNWNAPLVEIPAIIVAMRRVWIDGSIRHPGRYRYFITFRPISGRRMEFRVDGFDYMSLYKGDSGTLHYRGTDFLGFECERRQETAWVDKKEKAEEEEEG